MQMTYDAIGFALAIGIAVLAWQRSRAPGGYYDRDVYGMQRGSHLRYAAISAAFAVLFAAAYAIDLERAGIAALALYALVAVFYLSSFLRGWADGDE